MTTRQQQHQLCYGRPRLILAAAKSKRQIVPRLRKIFQMFSSLKFINVFQTPAEKTKQNNRTHAHTLSTLSRFRSSLTSILLVGVCVECVWAGWVKYRSSQIVREGGQLMFCHMLIAAAASSAASTSFTKPRFNFSVCSHQQENERGSDKKSEASCTTTLSCK